MVKIYRISSTDTKSISCVEVSHKEKVDCDDIKGNRQKRIHLLTFLKTEDEVDSDSEDRRSKKRMISTVRIWIFLRNTRFLNQEQMRVKEAKSYENIDKRSIPYLPCNHVCGDNCCIYVYEQC